MSNWKKRLCDNLEPILTERNPCPKLSAYHNMPYAIFRHSPEDEFDLRVELGLLKTRLEQAGKRVTVISLAELLDEAIKDAGLEPGDLIEGEKMVGLPETIETLHNILGETCPLDDLVLRHMPENPDKEKDIVFVTRAGALYLIYRTSSLLEQLMGKVEVPSVLFYPGEMDGAAGLRFMGLLDAEHNYRPKIF